jgi:adenylate cyclase
MWWRGKNEKAIAFAENAVARVPEHPLAHCNLAIALANAWRADEAKAAFNSFLRLRPDYSVERFRMTMPFKDPMDSSAPLPAFASSACRSANDRS